MYEALRLILNPSCMIEKKKKKSVLVIGKIPLCKNM